LSAFCSTLISRAFPIVFIDVEDVSGKCGGQTQSPAASAASVWSSRRLGSPLDSITGHGAALLSSEREGAAGDTMTESCEKWEPGER
jgi:hypothetical protein